MELRSAELQSEIAKRFGGAVELMQVKHGIFDDASISVISLATIAGIGREAGVDLDRRRFRANILFETCDHGRFSRTGGLGGHWCSALASQDRLCASRRVTLAV